MKNYPSTVSRTLNPANLGLVTVVGQHDMRLSDADVNLLQDLQDWKRGQLVSDQAPSGCLTLSPFVFYNNTPNQFTIPAFDVLFRGEVIRVGGNLSADPNSNTVILPLPKSGLVDGQLYVVFLELWYAALDPSDNLNFHVAPDGQRYFYPQGCVTALSPLLTQYLDDTIDPTYNRETTERVQLQWRLQVQPVPMGYNFNTNRYGLDPDTQSGGLVLGQGTKPVLTEQAFAPLAAVTGEGTLWRAGGDALNSVQTLDGYVYAMPVAMVFQRTLNVFNADTAPHGSATVQAGTGLFNSGISGRYDAAYADIILPGDVVDTRLTTSLTGYDLDPLLRRGLAGILTGTSRAKVARGEQAYPGLGSTLNHMVGLAASPAPWQNLQPVGAFDGFRNGISTDERTYFTSLSAPPPGAVWHLNDAVTVTLPASAVAAGAVITSIFVQSLNVQNQAISLMGTQIAVTHLGTTSVTVTIAMDLTALSSVNPGSNNLILTVGVTYPAASGVDTQKVPLPPVFGILLDPAAGSQAHPGLTLPLFGASDYDASVAVPPMLPGSVKRVEVFSPNFSSSIFGVRVRILVNNSTAVVGSVAGTYVFTVPRTQLDGRFTGLYVTQAFDVQGNAIPVVGRELSGANMAVTVRGPLPASLTTELVIFCHRTAQAAVSPAVKGIVAIEETLLMGSGSLVQNQATVGDLAAAPDQRLVVTNTTSTAGGGTTITGIVLGGRLKGAAGNDSGDQTGLAWVMQGHSDSFISTPCTLTVSVSAFTITIPGANLSTNTPWFIPISFLPGLVPGSQAIFEVPYVPYQGEGIAGRNYMVLSTTEDALVTTNGTGAAPVPGIQDVFPYDRELPVATTLPSLATWSDSDLDNAPIGGQDTNYTAKRKGNTETTFPAALCTNDFVPPLHGSVRRLIKVLSPTARGFAQTQPHVGFAITPPTPKTKLGLSFATNAPLTLYVDNVAGLATNNGLTPETPLPTVAYALALLPPILRHPVSILLTANLGVPYSLSTMKQTDFTLSSVEDGIYCMGEIAFTMQGAGSLTFGPTLVGLGAPAVVIDGSGTVSASSVVNFQSWAGTTPFAAFVVANGRVIFRKITFTAPPVGITVAGQVVTPPAFWQTYGAVRAFNADVVFEDCGLLHPTRGVTAYLGSSVSWFGGFVTLGSDDDLAIQASGSSVLVDSPVLTVDGGNPSQFFYVNNNSALTLQNHGTTAAEEIGFPLPGQGAAPTVAQADMSSSIIVTPSFSTNGGGTVQGSSVINFQTGASQFRGLAIDSTSSQVNFILN